MNEPEESAAGPDISTTRRATSVPIMAVIAATLVAAVLLARSGDDDVSDPSAGDAERSTTTTVLPTPTTTAPTTTAAPPTTVPSTTVPSTTVPSTTVPTTTTAAPVTVDSPCDGSPLAITGAFDGDHSLYVFDLEPAVLTDLLPDGPVSPSSPTWAPTCEAIAFISVESGLGSDRIHHLELSTGELTVLGEGPPGERLLHLTWSPDGDALAYARRTRGQLLGEDDDPPDMTAVDILAIGTREVTTVLTLPTLGGWLGVADIAWPGESGVTILYKSDRYNYDLIRADGERSTVHAIAGPKYSAHCCELSPDARYVAAASVFSSPDDSQMRVVDLATGESHDFTRDPDTVDQESADEASEGNRLPFSGWLESPSWSSDGTQVAFVHPEGRWECCDDEGFSTLTGGPTTVWLATIGESVATPIVSFDSNGSQRLSHDLAWPPGY